MHLSGVGEREMTLNLEGTKSLEEFLALVKARVDQARAGQWVTGRGWIETFWKPPVFPTRQDLDRIAPNNPVVLVRADGHASIANSAALRLAGITRDTRPPPGGAINKDASGEPTGMLTDRAMGLVERLVPPNTDAELDQQILKGVQREVELGWTQIQDAHGSWSEVERIRRLYRDGKIKIRIYKDISGPGRRCDPPDRPGPVASANSTAASRCATSRWSWTARWAAGARRCWRPTATIPAPRVSSPPIPWRSSRCWSAALRNGIQV